MVKIRLFNPSDAKSTSKLIRKALIEVNSKDYTPHVIKYMYDEFTPKYLVNLSQERRFFVAVDSNQVIGTATIIDDYVGTVFVSPKNHGFGVGAKLMKYVESFAKNQGIKIIRLYASITAVQFYEKLGYKIKEKNMTEEYGLTYEMTKEI
ncbi:MAG: GNAT family N-acetyltransferase [Candidatus Lokiarchaeota archaeon]|nr:GNAT family N-acetyltransferase [Candidatus Lokiarchaeota archaeon]